MKSGYVAILGRPNSGKSTLLNNLLGQKVSITSPKPQTTRVPLEAVYEEDRGQIIFVDTPGILTKVEDALSQKINQVTPNRLREGIDVAVHLIDHTRPRSEEENKILGVVRTLQIPKILVINKIDIKKPSYIPQYRFLEEEYAKTIPVSALFRTNLNLLIDTMFDLLPEGEKIVDAEGRPSPILSADSKSFLSEIVREKAFLFLRKEVPYTLTAIVDEVEERQNGTLYIKARIITASERYKSMIIGKAGRMVKEIGQAARKELQTATNKKVFLDLTVEVDPHWEAVYL